MSESPSKQFSPQQWSDKLGFRKATKGSWGHKPSKESMIREEACHGEFVSIDQVGSTMSGLLVQAKSW